MKIKKNIFDRLSLKKKISLNRQNKLSDQLSLESKKNTQLIEQIKDLQNNRKKDDKGLRSAYLLKSQNWYSQKLTEELDQKVTKQSFIEKELKGLQKKIAIEPNMEAREEALKNGISNIYENVDECLKDNMNKVDLIISNQSLA